MKAQVLVVLIGGFMLLAALAGVRNLPTKRAAAGRSLVLIPSQFVR
jgi:hypothetical protein